VMERWEQKELPAGVATGSGAPAGAVGALGAAGGTDAATTALAGTGVAAIPALADGAPASLRCPADIQPTLATTPTPSNPAIHRICVFRLALPPIGRFAEFAVADGSLYLLGAYLVTARGKSREQGLVRKNVDAPG